LGAVACRLSNPRIPVRRGGERPASLERELLADTPQALAWLVLALALMIAVQASREFPPVALRMSLVHPWG